MDGGCVSVQGLWGGCTRDHGRDRQTDRCLTLRQASWLLNPPAPWEAVGVPAAYSDQLCCSPPATTMMDWDPTEAAVQPGFNGGEPIARG